MSNDYEIFKGKSLASLFQDIYENQNYNRNQLDVLTKNITAESKGESESEFGLSENEKEQILQTIVEHDTMDLQKASDKITKEISSSKKD